MSRCGFFEYKGKRMLHIDVDNCSAAEFEAILEESGTLIRKEPLKSVLSLAVGGEGTPIFTDRAMFGNYLKMNAPHIKASAVAALPGLKAEMFSGALSGTSRNIMLFKTAEEAKEWLVSIT